VRMLTLHEQGPRFHRVWTRKGDADKQQFFGLDSAQERSQPDGF